MYTDRPLSLETFIKSYIEHKEQAYQYSQQRRNAEREYNRLLTHYEGETKNYTLEQANKIYNAWQEMMQSAGLEKKAEAAFLEAEQKLNEVGQILFEASITAEIPMAPPINGHAAAMRSVTVSYYNGQVRVN